ncbi:unnamed protein product, partial [Linum tenue]
VGDQPPEPQSGGDSASIHSPHVQFVAARMSFHAPQYAMQRNFVDGAVAAASIVVPGR